LQLEPPAATTYAAPLPLTLHQPNKHGAAAMQEIHFGQASVVVVPMPGIEHNSVDYSGLGT
jgi:hypothetical protein